MNHGILPAGHKSVNSTIVTATFVISAYLLPVILRVVHREYFVTYLLLVEDGVYESVGALACLVSGLLFGGLFLFCRHSVDQAPPKRNPWWLFFAVGFLVMFLEEMSWGQRVLGYSSPDFFADHNLTREANLHNMRTFYLRGTTTNVLQAVWMLLVLGYLGVLPFLTRFLPRFACWLKQIGLPTPTMAIAVAMILNTAGFVVYLLGTRVMASSRQASSRPSYLKRFRSPSSPESLSRPLPANAHRR